MMSISANFEKWSDSQSCRQSFFPTPISFSTMLDFSAPSPSESTSSGSHSSSGFDSSDPLDLNLILQDDMIQDSPTETDWSQLTSMFQEPMGYTDFGSMDFGTSNMVVEPSLLTKTNHYEYDFPFTFQSPPVLLAGDYGSVPRGMSVSSSEESSLDPAAELAQRVRESAGVVMAMPTSKSSSYRLGSFIRYAVSNTVRF